MQEVPLPFRALISSSVKKKQQTLQGGHTEAVRRYQAPPSSSDSVHMGFSPKVQFFGHKLLVLSPSPPRLPAFQGGDCLAVISTPPGPCQGLAQNGHRKALGE